MLHLIQDPTGPFNPHTLTESTPPEGAAFPVILAYVVVSLAAIAVTLIIWFQQRHAEEGSASHQGLTDAAVTSAGVTVGIILVAPLAVGMFWILNDEAPSTSPIIAALSDSPVTDPAGEFVEWADDRYGIELTDDEAGTLRVKRGISETDFSQAVTTADGLSLYSVFTPAGAITIHDGLTTDELDTTK